MAFRALGTPNNEVWPEVESLQDYKNTFPKWKPGSLASHVKNLDENGLDLLSVRSSLCTDYNWWFWMYSVLLPGKWEENILLLSYADNYFVFIVLPAPF